MTEMTWLSPLEGLWAPLLTSPTQDDSAHIRDTYRGRSRRHVVRLHICFITLLYTWRVPYQQSQMSCTHTWPSQVLLLLLWSLACWCDKGRRWCVDRRGSCFFTLIPAPPNNTQQRHFSFQVFTDSFFFFLPTIAHSVSHHHTAYDGPQQRARENSVIRPMRLRRSAWKLSSIRRAPRCDLTFLGSLPH